MTDRSICLDFAKIVLHGIEFYAGRREFPGTVQTDPAAGGASRPPWFRFSSTGGEEQQQQHRNQLGDGPPGKQGKCLIHGKEAPAYTQEAAEIRKKVVPEVGVEPTRAKGPRDFESRASANSATPAP